MIQILIKRKKDLKYANLENLFVEFSEKLGPINEYEEDFLTNVLGLIKSNTTHRKNKDSGALQ